MRRRLLISALTVLLGASVLWVLWATFDWPPPRLAFKYGFPPNGGPTGRSVTVEGVDFIELKPGCFRKGSHRGCSEGDFLGRLSQFLGLPFGEQPVHGQKECPPHWEEVSSTFWIARTELTVAQFRRYDPAHAQRPTPLPDWPATDSKWSRIIEYCEWLSLRSGLTVRVPTGDEWEYACRAGSPHTYPWGDAPEPLREYAWFEGNSGGRMHSVATLRPNRWGLFDMLGNVDERVGADLLSWVDERKSERVGVRVYTRSWQVGETVRGGYWNLPAEACRCGFMVWRSQAGGGGSGGFRPAASLPE